MTGVEQERRQAQEASAGTERPWLASYPADVQPSLSYPNLAIGHILDEVAGRHPSAEALVFQGQSLTWSQVQDRSEALSRSLSALGVAKGDRVVLLLPNVPHFVIAYYATLKLGAIVVAASPLFTEVELEHYLASTEPKVIITLDLLAAKVVGVRERQGIEHLVIGSVLDLLPLTKRLTAAWFLAYLSWIKRFERGSSPLAPVAQGLADVAVRLAPVLGPLRESAGGSAAYVGPGIHQFRDLLGHRSPGPAGTVVSPSDPAVILYTTGTTGRPKGALLSHANLIANASQMRQWFPQLKDGRETILAVLPFFHAYGLTLVMNAGLLLAARSVLIPRPILGDIFEAIKKYRPTALPGVPTLFTAIADSDRVAHYDLRSVRICVSGGAPLPVEVKQRFEALTGGHLYEGYGLTEAGPLTHAQPYDQSAPAGSIGLPVADTEAMLVDGDERPVRPGERGELLVRGPQVMLGYWREPKETADILRDGWLHTGDIATMDGEGFFFIVDRKKDLIITGGENIAPREIEEALYRFPKVHEAVVAGIPHQFGGEIAKAYVVLKQGETATPREIKRWLGTQLAHYKVPREVEFRTELPKSPMGKLLRRPLIDEERSRSRPGTEAEQQAEAVS